MKHTLLLTVALSLGVSTATLAQEKDASAGYNFIGVQGGAQATLTHYNFGDLLTPQFALQAGRYFNDKVGARFHVMGYENKGGFQQSRFPFLTEDVTYKFKGVTGDFDLLMNMSNIISPNRSCRAFDWVLLAGFGVNYTWDYDEFQSIVAQSNAGNYYTGPIVGETKRSSFNGRLGTQFNYNVADALTLGLELQANYKNDCYNLKYNDECDWQVAALIGLTYNFGYKTVKEPVSAPITSQADYEAEQAAAAAAAARAAEAARAKALEAQRKAEAERAATAALAKKNEPLNETIFFQIRESDPNKSEVLDKAAEWAKNHADKKITVTGYADKGTGTARVNKTYSELRAKKVADALKAKGVPADQLIVDAKGDKVQPYAENDQNRCTIIIGE